MSDTSSGRERSSGRASNQTGTKKNAPRERALASEGVLANLPRTRPQRSSARRDAARRAAEAQTSSALAATRKRATTKAKPTKAAAIKQDSAPRQGFESESDPVSGPVQPPGGGDLLASAAELAGELTKTGLSAGGRLLKDFLGRLPLN
jgi:hypothetical protein